MTITKKIQILKQIEKCRWIVSVVHWAEFFLLLAVCNGTVTTASKLTPVDDLMFVVSAEIVKHSWLLGILFVTRCTKSIIKVRQETLTQVLSWVSEGTNKNPKS